MKNKKSKRIGIFLKLSPIIAVLTGCNLATVATSTQNPHYDVLPFSISSVTVEEADDTHAGVKVMRAYNSDDDVKISRAPSDKHHYNLLKDRCNGFELGIEFYSESNVRIDAFKLAAETGEKILYRTAAGILESIENLEIPYIATSPESTFSINEDIVNNFILKIIDVKFNNVWASEVSEDNIYNSTIPIYSYPTYPLFAKNIRCTPTTITTTVEATDEKITDFSFEEGVNMSEDNEIQFEATNEIIEPVVDYDYNIPEEQDSVEIQEPLPENLGLRFFNCNGYRVKEYVGTDETISTEPRVTINADECPAIVYIDNSNFIHMSILGCFESSEVSSIVTEEYMKTQLSSIGGIVSVSGSTGGVGGKAESAGFYEVIKNDYSQKVAYLGFKLNAILEDATSEGLMNFYNREHFIIRVNDKGERYSFMYNNGMCIAQSFEEILSYVPEIENVEAIRNAKAAFLMLGHCDYSK